MHYQHRFHAGNFADVFKHGLLCGLLLALNRKDKPWCFFDTHAGSGRYDLGDDRAEQTGEWRDGIGRLAALQNPPEPLASYLRIVAAAQPYYPGSPRIALALARAGDRLVLCERVAEIVADLRQSLQGDSRAHLHCRDGYEARGLLPPPEKRGLVLVDPPFERADEFDAAAEFLGAAIARFATGTYAVWYPLKNRHAAGRFVRRVVRESGRAAIDFTFDTGARAEGQMHACGTLVVNPPFRFAEDVTPALQLLARHLQQGPTAAFDIEEYPAGAAG